MGVLLEARYFPEELGEIMAAVQGGESLVAAENRILGVDHALLGAWLAERWRLPPVIRESILRHHEIEAGDLDSREPAELEGDPARVLHYVTVANLLAQRLGFDYQDRAERTVELPPHLLKTLQGKPIEEVCEQIRERLESSREFLTA